MLFCALLLILFLDQSEVLAVTYESCKTPRGEDGECISIRECDALYSLLATKPLLPAYVEYLKKSHCGFLEKIPKVCCTMDDLTSRMADTAPDDMLPDTSTNNLPTTDECGFGTGRKISGGEKTDLDEFPWMSLIIYELPNHRRGFGCGGALISKRYVLTAAHCLKGKHLNKLWKLVAVRLGEYNKDSDKDCLYNGFVEECLLSPPVNVLVEERIPHELYDPDDPNQKHDIALLRLKQDVNFTTYIKPVCLPVLEEERNRTYAGSNLMVAGWGQTETNNYSSSVKLKVELHVKANEDCNKIYKKAGIEVSQQQLCAGGDNNKNSCKGDSGGCLMTVNVDGNGDAVWYAAGIVSFGTDTCGKEGWPSVYTRVSKYMGWILRHIKP